MQGKEGEFGTCNWTWVMWQWCCSLWVLPKSCRHITLNSFSTHPGRQIMFTVGNSISCHRFDVLSIVWEFINRIMQVEIKKLLPLLYVEHLSGVCWNWTDYIYLLFFSFNFFCQKVLRQENVDYIVAPYEADAQMTYLSIKRHVEAVITEDSDLIPFGCLRVRL